MAKFSLLEIYKKVDIFGQSVAFNANGKETVNSCVGATMSILVTFVTIAYAWTRLDVLLQFGDTRYQETLTYREGQDSEIFHQNVTNFNIAFGIRPIVPNSSYITEEEQNDYLSINAYMSNREAFTFLDYHNCTSEDRKLFYDEAKDGDVDTIEQDFYALKCLDDVSQVNLQGNFKAEIKNVFGITLAKCTETSNCKSVAEIADFIGKYYVEIIYNQQVYIPTKYGDDEIIQNRISS